MVGAFGAVGVGVEGGGEEDDGTIKVVGTPGLSGFLMGGEEGGGGVPFGIDGLDDGSGVKESVRGRCFGGPNSLFSIFRFISRWTALHSSRFR